MGIIVFCSNSSDNVEFRREIDQITLELMYLDDLSRFRFTPIVSIFLLYDSLKRSHSGRYDPYNEFGSLCIINIPSHSNSLSDTIQYETRFQS